MPKVDVLRGVSEPLRTELLYDVANFTSLQYNHTSDASAPEDFVLTGAFGAALRVKDHKLVLGCGTLTGCARWAAEYSSSLSLSPRNYNSTWDGAVNSTAEQLYDLSQDPGETTNLAANSSMAEVLSSREVTSTTSPRCWRT